MLSSQFAVSSFYLTSFQRSVMSRPIFHELQIEAVQHGADRDAEKHSKNAEHLAVLPPAHNVPSGGRADIDCKEVFHSFNSVKKCSDRISKLPSVTVRQSAAWGWP